MLANELFNKIPVKSPIFLTFICKIKLSEFHSFYFIQFTIGMWCHKIYFGLVSVCREKDKHGGSLKYKEEDKRKSTESLPVKSRSLAVRQCGADEPIDLSASHPNVSLAATATPTQLQHHSSRPSSSASSASSYHCDDDDVTESAMSISDKDQPETATTKEELSSSFSLREPSTSPVVELSSSSIDPDAHKTPEDLAADIDNALAEVMSNIQSLGMRHNVDTGVVVAPSASKPSLSVGGDFKRTPDLVIDLPIGVAQQPTSPKAKTPVPAVIEKDSPVLTTAEVFANMNQCTIKKGTPHVPAITPASTSTSTVMSFSNRSSGIGNNEVLSTGKHPLRVNVDLKPSVNIAAGRASNAPLEIYGQSFQQESTAQREGISPPPRVSSRQRTDRYSDASWPSFPMEIHYEKEFVRSFIPPFGIAPTHRMSYCEALPVDCTVTSPSQLEFSKQLKKQNTVTAAVAEHSSPVTRSFSTISCRPDYTKTLPIQRTTPGGNSATLPVQKTSFCASAVVPAVLRPSAGGSSPTTPELSTAPQKPSFASQTYVSTMVVTEQRSFSGSNPGTPEPSTMTQRPSFVPQASPVGLHKQTSVAIVVPETATLQKPPDGSVDPTVSEIISISAANPTPASPLPQRSPERTESIGKPPVKAKPPIMKKPVRSNELLKRMHDSQSETTNVKQQ